MFLYFPFFFTFTVLSFLSHASISIAGRSRLHRQSLQTHQHQPRNPSPANSPQNARSRNSIYKRSPASSDEGSVEIPLTQLQLLQVEIDSFQEWMGAWFESKNSTDSTPSMDLLQDEIQAYEGWMQAWLKAAISTSTAAEPTLPTSVAISGLASTSITSSSLSASRGSSTYQVSSPTSAIFSSSKSTIGTVGYFSSVSESPTATRSSYPTSSTTTLVSAGQFYQPSQSGSLPSAGVSTIQSLNKSPPEAQSSTTAASVSSAHIPASSSSAVSTSEYTGTSIKSSTSSYRFNAQASDNVAVYYGQSDATSQTSLEAICQDSNVDIVILAFLTDFFNADGYPTINFRAGCSSPTSEMSSKAPGLLDCPVLSSQMTVCQGLGKKVLLSLGGALADTSLSSDSQASQLATTLWNLFGAGSGEDPSLRPFGQARVDGFDIDNEDHSTAYYTTFISSLRAVMNTDTSKPYYLSAAPQCPRPDASIPLSSMQTMDFVWVQFYNNGDCNVGQAGFDATFQAWSADLSANRKGPRLFIGAPSFAGGGTGYLDTDSMAGVIEGAKAMGVGNLGGVMLWDGAEGMGNVEGGKNYMARVKGALG